MVVLHVLVILVGLFGRLIYAVEQPNQLDTSNIVIKFSPYVSILDTYNKSRYGVDDMIPFISLVATRFKRLYIKLGRVYNNEGEANSLLLSPKAVAKYNCLNTTNEKIEVILDFDPGYNGCQGWEGFKCRALSYANTVNDICEGTVQSIASYWICNTDFNCSNSKSEASSFRQYQWFSRPFWDLSFLISNSNNTSKFFKISPKNVIHTILHYYNLNGYFKRQSIIAASNETWQRKKIWHTFDFSDQFYNLSGFISNWKEIPAIKNQTFIVNWAFDEPMSINSQKGLFHLGKGWWHLVDDPGNTDTNRFQFEEKNLVASKVDEEESPKNFDWLYNEIVFNNMTTGMVSSETKFDYLLNIVCRVLVLEHANVSSLITTNETKNLETCKPLLDIIFIGNPGSVLIDNSIHQYATFTHLATTSFDITREDNRLTFRYKILPLKNRTSLGILQYGYSFDLKLCAYSMKWKSNPNLMNVLKDPNSRMYLFTYMENHYYVKQGATRMFQRIKVLFKECQKMVFDNRNHSTKVAFALEGYYREDKFYSSPLDLQNYVKYISLLNDWVGGQADTIMFLGQGVDTTTIYWYNRYPYPTVGWYFDRNSSLRNKQQDALEISLKHFPKPIIITKNVTVHLNSTQTTIFSPSVITTIALVSMTLLGLPVIITIYFTRRYYSKNTFSREEIYKFLHGEDSQDESNIADRAPYDKNKYEISSDSFTIEGELGSGEFGKVCQGKITKGADEFTVAVKTSNPKTFHKTVLAGLLSEIKLLAYIGKHQNIVELLGANTEKLKDGKIYLFLELCRLGSLDKILKEMGQRTSSSAADEQPKKSVSLDPNSSEDLWKWSIEICNGMKYLAEKHVVHADLATRNVLLNLRKEAKICDFGLSRRMYNYTNYVKTQQEPLPWKWMAPESLNYMTFSEKSDVWAYGVTLWEMYSLGKSPYPGLSWDVNFAGMLERGLRLSEPEFNERNMYEFHGYSVMSKCWKIDVERRPTFQQLYEILDGPQTGTADIAESVV